ncbi:hypothetical protein AERO8C_150034 [Aeromonas veronii]|uniref:Uncharacterized protein n=1 Tax=Aeromonas veronii TaxID=654 RepID=A0A653KWL4_AERVE|nr:hypothetical protein AERO8C_150034 [Aeromonas veronii]
MDTLFQSLYTYTQLYQEHLATYLASNRGQ